MKRIIPVLKISFQVSILTVIFYFIYKSIELQEFLGLIKKANLQLLLIVLLIEGFCVFIQASRWFILLQNFPGKKFWEIQYINYSAMFFDLFVPGKLGSDSYRVISFKKKEKISNIIGSLFTHRIQGLILSLLTLIVFTNIYSDLINISTLLNLLILAILIVIFSLFYILTRIKEFSFQKYRWLNTKIVKIIENLIILTDYINQLLHSAKRISLTVTINISFILLSSVAFAIAGKAFESNLNLSYYFIGTPAIMIVSMIPITIHGRGITEATALYFWSNSANSAEQVLLTCFTVYGCNLFLSIFASTFFIARKLILEKSIK